MYTVAGGERKRGINSGFPSIPSNQSLSLSHSIVFRGDGLERGETCQDAMVSAFRHHGNLVPVDKLQVISIDSPLRKEKHTGPG